MDPEESRASSASENDEVIDVESEHIEEQLALADYAERVWDPAARAEPVWAEHSYSGARRPCGAGGAHGCRGLGRAPGPELLVLGAARPPRCPHCRDPDPAALDVLAAPSPPSPPASLSAGDTDDDDDRREEPTASAAADPARRKLAADAARVLGDLRLAESAARGASGARRAARREAARRLRRVLAGGLTSGAAAWLAGELATRRAGSRVLAELARAAPALAARLGLAGARDPWAPPPSPPPAPLHARPTLLWLPSGQDGLDERWERRFRLLFPVRRVRFPQPERCGVERWAGALLERARAAARGAGGAVLAGAGAGAALALRVCGAGSAGGVLGLGPPLLTAEAAPGPPAAPPAPVLLVVGEHSERGGPAEAAECAAGRGGARVLVVAGADHALRRRARAGPPQHALDAAVVSHAARWLLRPPPPAATPAVPPAPPAADDIMRMPIVFADDEPAARRGRGRPRVSLL